jgi:hypothetical protein
MAAGDERRQAVGASHWRQPRRESMKYCSGSGEDSTVDE